MLSRTRRCLDCGYAWSRYLSFPSCPRCGADLEEAATLHQLNRTRKLRIAALGIVVAAWLLMLVSLFLGR